MILNYVIFFASVLLVFCKNLPEDNAAIISKYAKVAHWGAVLSTTTEKSREEGRSHIGQTPWTHRSDVNIIRGQNSKTVKPVVVYQYPVQKVSHRKSEIGVGEVQERFNPRPYFDYGQVSSKYSKNQNAKPSPSIAPPTQPSFDNFPVYNQSPDTSDLYSSPITSYNPPNAGPVAPPDDNPDVAYPPNAPPPPGDTDDNPDSHPDEGYSYNSPQPPPAPQEPPSYPSLGPPLASHDEQSDQVYYPPSDNGGETILDHPPPGWEDEKPEMGPAPDMAENGMKGHDMAEGDLAPPPPSVPDNNGQFPPYLYGDPHGQGHDFGDYSFNDHHVYKEVTTTTEAPEDERVNKGHYSYYYLGRKLWYIPLYFSVYFIIYVTVLILKSIARHKVQFKHDHLHFRKEHGRQLDLDEIHENITTAINTTRRRFPYVAM